jgi:hypothetical protein
MKDSQQKSTPPILEFRVHGKAGINGDISSRAVRVSYQGNAIITAADTETGKSYSLVQIRGTVRAQDL